MKAVGSFTDCFPNFKTHVMHFVLSCNNLRAIELSSNGLIPNVTNIASEFDGFTVLTPEMNLVSQVEFDFTDDINNLNNIISLIYL